jgi:hypothetical protein
VLTTLKVVVKWKVEVTGRNGEKLLKEELGNKAWGNNRFT